ncbi:MAG: hypothetical protein GY906_18015 [bacterium]|nr:hypothetical protein [bacterium]
MDSQKHELLLVDLRYAERMVDLLESMTEPISPESHQLCRDTANEARTALHSARHRLGAKP